MKLTANLVLREAENVHRLHGVREFERIIDAR